MAREKCQFCGHDVVLRVIDDRVERVMVSPGTVDVVIQIPGLEGYTVVAAERLHRCHRRGRGKG